MKQLLADIETIKLRARATSKQHTLKFYPEKEMYIFVEGNDIRSDAIVLARDFNEEPYKLDINRTDLGGDEVMVITPFGDITPPGTVQLTQNNTTINVTIDGIDDAGFIPIVTSTAEDVETVVEKLVGGLLKVLP